MSIFISRKYGRDTRSPTPLRHWPLASSCIALTLLMAVHAAADRLVVLHNGNTFSGQVTEQEHRVLVVSDKQRVAFESRDVDMVVASLTEAYRRKAARISQANTHAREKLLSWCIRHHLANEAQEQLNLLHKQHPSFPRLKLWRQRIDSHEKLAGKTVLPAKAPLHPDAQLARRTQSQLSKSTQSHFVRSIQPILLNGCGLANCHGRATRSHYQLVSGRSPLARSVTQRNLGATLRQIDDAAPEQSLLWMSAAELHGGAEEDPLTREELEKILGWILVAHSETRGQSVSVAHGKQSVAESTVDPFDPAEFNKMR